MLGQLLELATADCRAIVQHEQGFVPSIAQRASPVCRRSQALLHAQHFCLRAGEMGALQDAMGTGSTDQADMLGRLLTRVAALDAALGTSQAAQRQLRNQLIELRGNVSLR